MPDVHARRRAVALLVLAVLVGVAAAVALRDSGGGPDGGPPEAGAGPGQRDDPLRYRASARASFEEQAALGLSHVLYAKSPGGATATAARVARWRPLVERAAGDGAVVDADTLEAIVFLESAGRDDAQAGNDLNGAVGLTQILAQTATGLLGMRVDVRASARLTRGIARGRKVAARRRARRRVDERFDPAKALAGTVRYLAIARKELGRADLAVVSYHMGIGNLQRALGAYGADRIPYAQLFFDSTPLRHPRAWDVLAALGDDSATYLWRIRAAQRIMRLYRTDPVALAREQDLQTQKASAENLLRPPASTPVFGDPFAVGRARADRTLSALPTDTLRDAGIRVDPRMGELARRLNQSRRLYRALRPEALTVLLHLGGGVRAIAGRTAPLILTSTVRDTQYQRLLVARNSEATRNFSLHTTGYAFDIERAYASRAQAQAFQFMLDRLTALNVIAWVREPAAIHVTAGPRARLLTRTG